MLSAVILSVHSYPAVLLAEQLVHQRYVHPGPLVPVSYTHLRAHETKANLVCRLLLEKKKVQ